MVKGRIEHGLIEAIWAERFNLFHGKAEQPCLYACLGSCCGQLKAKMGTAKLRESHLVMQKPTVCSTKAEDGLVPCFYQKADLPVQLQQMGIVRYVGQLVGAFNFQNPYGINRCTPDQHKIKMGFDGHALMLPVDLKLG